MQQIQRLEHKLPGLLLPQLLALLLRLQLPLQLQQPQPHPLPPLQRNARGKKGKCADKTNDKITHSVFKIINMPPAFDTNIGM